MVTADNITDEQIRKLRDSSMAEWRQAGDWDWRLRLTIELCDSAVSDALDHGGRYARARCAEILNAEARGETHFRVRP